MAQLVDRVRQVERLTAGKTWATKFSRKEKVTYVDTNDDDSEFDINFDDAKTARLILQS